MTASVLDIKLHKGEHITWVRQNPPPPLAFPLARIAKRQECKNFQPGLWVLEPTPKKLRMTNTRLKRRCVCVCVCASGVRNNSAWEIRITGARAHLWLKKKTPHERYTLQGRGRICGWKKKLRMRDTHYRGEGAFVVEKKTPHERYALQGGGL